MQTSTHYFETISNRSLRSFPILRGIPQKVAIQQSMARQVATATEENGRENEKNKLVSLPFSTTHLFAQTVMKSPETLASFRDGEPSSLEIPGSQSEELVSSL